MTTKEGFLKDTADHVMEILHEDPLELYRHIRFRKPGTMCMHFDLITWPGYLCYTGDMGTYVFRRLEDMFQFFRSDRPDPFEWIDKRYWAEKLEASDKGDGHREFDKKAFKREITVQRRKLFVEHCKHADKDIRKEFWDSFDEVFDAADEGEHRVYAAVQDWEFNIYTMQPSIRAMKRNRVYLDTSDFPDCKTYTHRFRWCCFALAWGTQKYDKAKNATG